MNVTYHLTQKKYTYNLTCILWLIDLLKIHRVFVCSSFRWAKSEPIHPVNNCCHLALLRDLLSSERVVRSSAHHLSFGVYPTARGHSSQYVAHSHHLLFKLHLWKRCNMENVCFNQWKNEKKVADFTLVQANRQLILSSSIPWFDAYRWRLIPSLWGESLKTEFQTRKWPFGSMLQSHCSENVSEVAVTWAW